jgi:hypothetical protein
MRFLRRLTLNRRAVFDNSLYVDINGSVIMDSRTALKLPHGLGDDAMPSGGFGDADNERPVVPQNGMMRYNETTFDIEVYQGSTWRALRYRESGQITQQTLGVGDGDTVYFGPLNPAPPDISQRGYTWTGSNLLVIVENVIQLHTTNYTVEQNPTFSAETYYGTISRTELVTATRLYFNTSLQTTGASGSSTTATLTFAEQPAAPFSIGETILVTGMTPYGYNGEAVVTACNTTSVSYVNTTTGAQTVAGTITSIHTIYPAVDITGAAVSGTGIPALTTVVTYTTDDATGALTSIDISQPITGSPITAGTAITIAELSQTGSGWYLQFSSPVPPGKPVTVLHGFDQ